VNYDLENQPIGVSTNVGGVDWKEFAMWYQQSPFIKKASFRSEREYRLPIIVGETQAEFGSTFSHQPNIELGNFKTFQPSGWPNKLELPWDQWKSRTKYVYFLVDPSSLIQEVRIQPGNERFRSELIDLLGSYGLHIPILTSQIKL
jgi:hypothetical protein